MDEMKRLVDRLNETSYAYYVLDDPVISDDEWDDMYAALRRMEAESGVVLFDSPTRCVGGEPLSAFEPHVHLAPLYSLDKVRSPQAVAEWAARAEKALGAPPEFVVEYKFDGLTINLTYDGGELVEAATRGSGTVGEAILAQVKTIRSIPLTVPYKGRFEAQATMSGTLKRMERGGAIARRSDEGDARVSLVRLTEEGTRLCERARDLFVRTDEMMFEGVPDAECERMFAMFETVLSNLEKGLQGEAHEKTSTVP